MQKDHKPQNEYFQDVLYLQRKLKFPPWQEKIREIFDIGNDSLLALTQNSNLIFIDPDPGYEYETNLKCSYNLPKILKQLGLISKCRSLKIYHAFYLAPNYLALKIDKKIFFFSIWQHKEHSFQIRLPTSHSLFQLSDDLLSNSYHINTTRKLRAKS